MIDEQADDLQEHSSMYGPKYQILVLLVYNFFLRVGCSYKGVASHPIHPLWIRPWPSFTFCCISFVIFISKVSINVQFSKTVHDIVGYQVSDLI